jgi:starch phosphorylase
MVNEYMSELYQPAHNLWTDISRDNFEEARQRTVWDSRMNQNWDRIRFIGLGDGPADQVMSGSAVPLRAIVDLAGLEPSEVRVEAVIGQIGVNGQLQDTYTLPLSPIEERGTAVVFGNEFSGQPKSFR